MKNEFPKALRAVLVYEGGKVNHPKDPGGKTNQGVTQRTFTAFLAERGKANRDVYTMTNAERDAIYKKQYWDRVQGDKLPPGLGFILFDGAVNSGVTQSVKWIQRALKDMGQYSGLIDGAMGMGTLSAIRNHSNHDMLVRAWCERRMMFLKALRTWKTFGKGWTTRVNHVLATGQAWAMGDVGPAVSWSPEQAFKTGMSAKATFADAKTVPMKSIADQASGAGIASGTATGGVEATLANTIDTTKAQFEPFAYTFEWISYILIILTIAGLTIGLGALAYRYFARAYERRLKDALNIPEPGYNTVPV